MTERPTLTDVEGCPFCRILQHHPDQLIAGTPLAAAIPDKYPVNPGHVLIIPRRHYASFFDATNEELRDFNILLRRCRDIAADRYSPDGFNIGVNINRAAGQSMFHLHIHLIPRYTGDMKRPLGGVRHVIPDRGAYETDY